MIGRVFLGQLLWKIYGKYIHKNKSGNTAIFLGINHNWHLVPPQIAEDWNNTRIVDLAEGGFPSAGGKKQFASEICPFI